MTAAITDFNHFTTLRASAERNDPAALREVAGQFEALFVQTILKGMRDASIADPIFGQSDQHEMYQDMLDKQYAIEMSSGRGIGLADMLVRQLGGAGAGIQPPSRDYVLPEASPDGRAAAPPVWSGPEDFAQNVWPHAVEAAKKLNVSPEALLAQAALETGWGEHVMRRPDGGSSFNLFGIKAQQGWNGDTVSKRTIEYRGGIATQERARFRAYADVKAAFDDYVALIGGNSRYEPVRNHGGDAVAFANALQQSGYATDPNYAQKINAVMAGDTMGGALGGLKKYAPQPIDHRGAQPNNFSNELTNRKPDA